MTNKFVDYEFLATDTTTIRTLPDRLSDFKNVMDYGALGDGTGALLNTRYATLAAAQAVYPFVTDITTQTIDWAAITAAFNWTSSTVIRGTIFFPPGTYVVSEPVDLEPAVGMIFLLTGSLGASIIVGNFNDYVLKKTDGGSAAANQAFIEKLTVINNHATGGGIRLGGCVGAALRDCDVTANIGINTTGDDGVDGGSTSLEFTIINCKVNPGSNTSGSIGIVAVANGVIANCRIIGYEKGAITWGQQGEHEFQGCYFEGNEIAVRTGMKPNGLDQFDAGSTFTGCVFKNNGTALYLPNVGGQIHLTGIRIDGDESITVYGSRPQYGIHMVNILVIIDGVIVTGQYDQAAIVVNNGNTVSNYTGVFASNTSTHGGIAWDMTAVSPTPTFTACNIAPIAATGDLIFNSPITSVTWSGGTATLTWAFGALSGGQMLGIFVSGVGIAGYNGTFIATTGPSFNQCTYTVAGPLAPDSSGGNIAINNKVLPEGGLYDVSDSSVTTWSDPLLGGGSIHALALFNGTTLTVVGI